MKRIILLLACAIIVTVANATDLKHCKIAYDRNDAPLVSKMATTLSDDIERVTGYRPPVVNKMAKGSVVVLSTVDRLAKLCPGIKADELRGSWERYKITTKGNRLVIIGSDARGLAYGVLHVSEREVPGHLHQRRGLGTEDMGGKELRKRPERHRSQDIRQGVRTYPSVEGQHACTCHAYMHRCFLQPPGKSGGCRRMGHHDYHKPL